MAVSEQLQAAIDDLYRVFEHYQLTRYFIRPGFPEICDPAPLRAHPLRLLPADSFEIYGWKAVSTWGKADDLRHFLPRMLELVDMPGSPIETERLFSKLAYAGWRKWPREEQHAIENYINTRWYDLTHLVVQSNAPGIDPMDPSG